MPYDPTTPCKTLGCPGRPFFGDTASPGYCDTCHAARVSEERSTCEVCREPITKVVEAHTTYWTSDEDGDSLSYVPDLHDHQPAPVVR